LPLDHTTAAPAVAISVSTSLCSLDELVGDCLASSASIKSELKEELIEEYVGAIDVDELFPVGSAYEHSQPLETITEEGEDVEDNLIWPPVVPEIKQRLFISR
jgi:hypothetical protein